MTALLLVRACLRLTYLLVVPHVPKKTPTGTHRNKKRFFFTCILLHPHTLPRISAPPSCKNIPSTRRALLPCSRPNDPQPSVRCCRALICDVRMYGAAARCFVLFVTSGYFPKAGMLSGGAGDLFFGMLNASCCALGFRMFYNRDILSANLVSQSPMIG